MLNIAETLHTWCRAARPFALATVVQVSGSAPLPVGTALAVDTDGNAVGSVSGGCVEGAVYELCRQILKSGEPPTRARFGYSDDDAFAVGLTCGGELDVLVQRIDPADLPHLTAVLDEVALGRPVAVAQIIDGPEELLGSTLCVTGDDSALDGTLGRVDWERAVAAQARALLRAGRTGRVEVGGEVGGQATTCPRRLSVLVHTHASRPRMLIFGAVDFAGALSEIGRFLGYRVTVCDARPVFATAARFPHADDIDIAPRPMRETSRSPSLMYFTSAPCVSDSWGHPRMPCAGALDLRATRQPAAAPRRVGDRTVPGSGVPGCDRAPQGHSRSGRARSAERRVQSGTAGPFRRVCQLMRISAGCRRYLLVSSEAGLPSLVMRRRR
ncbi:XdhC family protein [Streptomyces olindensis]|uniref:XdhC family protein n=1 Tax=Streptomyces olindensis TaxID=358823 RepID=A0ABV2XRN4_9ACTN